MKEKGTACFFSASANERLPAGDERLNSEQLTAAHASYPLGSWVKVTNLANGKAVELQIVDRFPRASQRIISVSEAAARELEFIRAGTAEVRVEPILEHVASPGRQ